MCFKMANESTAPGARGFVRSLNVLLKYVRLYGLEHSRSAAQFHSTWNELLEATKAAGESGLLLGASGSQLLLDGVPLESTPAERSFALLLEGAGVASICFGRGTTREGFAQFVRAFIETGPKSANFAERLEANLGASSGIRVNQIRFVAEDASVSEARLAAQLTIKTLGAEADRVQDWFSSPEKMIQLIAAAEGAHGGPGGPGTGPDTGAGPGVGPGAGPGRGPGAGPGSGGGQSGGQAPGGMGFASGMVGGPSGSATGGVGGATMAGPPGTAAIGFGAGVGSGQLGYVQGAVPAGYTQVVPLEEAEMQSLLRLIVQFGEATHGKRQLDAATWQARLSSLPPNAQVTLRQALAGVAAQNPSARVDEAMMLRLAEDLAIRFAL